MGFSIFSFFDCRVNSKPPLEVVVADLDNLLLWSESIPDICKIKNQKEFIKNISVLLAQKMGERLLKEEAKLRILEYLK